MAFNFEGDNKIFQNDSLDKDVEKAAEELAEILIMQVQSRKGRVGDKGIEK